jgi:hypothetical protein
VGTYFFADYCAARIYSGTFAGDTLSNVVERTARTRPARHRPININQITSFGEDSDGELYICDQGGEVFKIVARSALSGAARRDVPADCSRLPGAMPFRSSLRLALDLPVAARVRLGVFDLAGRQVRALTR